MAGNKNRTYYCQHGSESFLASVSLLHGMHGLHQHRQAIVVCIWNSYVLTPCSESYTERLWYMNGKWRNNLTSLRTSQWPRQYWCYFKYSDCFEAKIDRIIQYIRNIMYIPNCYRTILQTKIVSINSLWPMTTLQLLCSLSKLTNNIILNLDITIGSSL